MSTAWVTHMQEYCTCAAHTRDNRHNVIFIFNTTSNGQKRAGLSNIEIPLTWYVRPSMENWMHVHPGQLDRCSLDNTCQAQGLDKLDRPTILTPVEVTTLDTGQCLSILKGSTNLSPLYLSPPWTSDNLQKWTTFFACKPAQSLGGLCTVQGL